MNIKNGGPAFPQVPELDLGKDGEITLRCDGISVLDYFAAEAMKSVLEQASTDQDFQRVGAELRVKDSKTWEAASLEERGYLICKRIGQYAAKSSYIFADAMVAERELRNKP